MKKKRLIALLSATILVVVFMGCGSGKTAQMEKLNVTIILNYEEVFLTSNTTMNVYIDDTKIGRQEAGSKVSYDVSLEKGSHTFCLKNDGI